MPRFFPKRRFRFTLRALLLVVTAFGVFWGSQARIVHQRRAAIAQIEEHGGWAVVWEPLNTEGLLCGLYAGSHAVWGEVRVPRVRAWFGDKPICEIGVRSHADLKLAQKLFPEAGLMMVDFDDGPQMFSPQTEPRPFGP